MKLQIVLRVLFCSLFFVVLGFTVQAATFTVTNANDAGAGSLRQAVIDANTAASDDVIEFDPIFFASGRVITLAGGELTIAANGSLTINGTGQNLLWLSGGNLNRVLFVSSGARVVINKVRLRDGKPAANGGAVFNDGAVLTINDSDISGNEVTGSNSGGGIYNRGGLLTLNRTAVHTNKTSGGAGGGVYSNDFNNPNAFLTLSDSVVVGNVSVGRGGGIYSRSKLNLNATRVDSNAAQGDDALGGNIYTAAETALNNSNIVLGRALQGAGIYIDETTATVTGGVFSSNHATGSGGGFYSRGTLNITGTNIQFNRAVTGNGAGIYKASGSLSVANASFNGHNCDAGTGSGIYSSQGAVAVSGTTFINNFSNLSGSGMAINNGSLTLNSSLLTGNVTSSNGAGLNLSASTASITNSTFGENRAQLGGGGIYLESSAALDLESSTISRNISDDDNNNSGAGGGIHNSGGTVNVHNTIIAGNVDKTSAAPEVAGALHSLGFNLILNMRGASGRDNSDIVNLDPQLLPLASNGGLTQTYKLPHSSPAIDAADPSNFPNMDQRGKPRPFDGEIDGTFLPDIGAYEKDTAKLIVTKTADTGDGVCDGDCSLREAITTANSTVTDDVIFFDAAVFGAPQTILLNGTSLDINYNGSVTIKGPGADRLAVSGNDLARIFLVNTNSVVEINAMTFRNGWSNCCGAVMYNAGNVTFNDSVMRDSDGGTFGGAIQNAGVLNISRSRLTNLKAFQGGAIYNNESRVLNITDTTISNNQAVRNGGGLTNKNGKVTILNSTISGNSAVGDGEGSGGGIHNSGGSATTNALMTITNSTIADNVTRFGGGGIVNFEGALVLTNATITGNSTLSTTIFHKGGGIYSDSDGLATSVTARNTIVADNTTGSGLAPDFAGVLTSQGYNLIENLNGIAITGVATGNRLGLDPLLGPLADNGGLTQTRLPQAGGPALDGGDPNNFPARDQRGVRRSRDGDQNGTVLPDIGAAETGFYATRIAPVDFDGDGKTDVSIFRPAAGEWWYLKSSTGGNAAVRFGLSTDKLVPGDFTGDGKADIAYFRPSSGEWFILRSENSSFFSLPFGTSEDIPVPADFDGDGKTDVAVFRPSTGLWYIMNSSGVGTSIVQFGTAEDKPVPADFDGDGKTDIAIFRPSDGSWWYLQSTTAQFKVFRFGVSTDKPVQGDYTGDGKADLAVYRPASGEWFVQRSEDNSFYSVPFGASGDVPAPGDYDGDGKFDTGVFRSSGFTWFVNRTAAGLMIMNFGTVGDMPVPTSFIH